MLLTPQFQSVVSGRAAILAVYRRFRRNQAGRKSVEPDLEKRDDPLRMKRVGYQGVDILPVAVGRHRYQIAVPEGDHIGEVIRTSGHPYEQDLLRTLAPFVWPSHVVVDVGANVGNHALYFAVTRGAFVHAFEPNLESRRYLRRSIAASQIRHVMVHPEALSDECGSAALVAAEDLGLVRVETAAAGDIAVRRLDQFMFASEMRIAVLKVDVEGDEARVVEGAQRTIRQHRPLIAVEARTAADRRAIAEVLPKGYRRLPLRFGLTPTYIYYPNALYLAPLIGAAVCARAGGAMRAATTS